MNNAKFGKCAFCSEEKELCKSHIIPKFTRNILNDKDDKIYRFVSLELSDINKQTTEILTQDLPKEYILCKTCEDYFGKFEKYFKEIYSDNKIKATQDETSIYVEEIDNFRIKQFILSILWRASKSKSYFNTISLGEYEIRIEELLKDPSLINTYNYPIYLFSLSDKDSKYQSIELSKIIEYPKKKIFLGFTTYFFIIYGLLWIIIITEKDELVKKKLPIIPSLNNHNIMKIYKGNGINLKDKIINGVLNFMIHFNK